MTLLLDTQIIIWLQQQPDNIPSCVKDKIYTSSSVYFSSVSVWEIALKLKLNKLNIGLPLPDFVTNLRDKYQFSLLSIELPHIYYTQQLQLHHQDPFDRLIIAQSLVENIPVVSSDAAFDAYSVNRIWK